MIKLYKICLICFLVLSTSVMSQTPGFFKDVFVDGGVNLTSMLNFPAAEALGLEVEYLSTENESVQSTILISNNQDSNGHLLYPDGLPRFRLLYCNGGRSTTHGNSLGETGRDRIRTYYAQGGSFVGSCAGAFITSLHYEAFGVNDNYYHIWPGRMKSTGLIDSYTDHDIPITSPLLNYFKFGSNQSIEHVRHNGGGYAREDIDFPSETEVLLRYDYPAEPGMHGKVSTWAYKPSDHKGRIVVTGSHPEFVPDGENFDLMTAMLLYALEGVGSPTIKAQLKNGEPRVMDQFSEDKDPDHTRIGDKQYHHFTVDVPYGPDSVTIELNAEDGFAFNLYVNPSGFAFEDTALFSSSVEGSNHKLTLPISETGVWYIGVECATTVSSANNIYWGKTEVLNGIAYTVSVNWDTANVVGIRDLAQAPAEFELYPNYPNPFNPTTTIRYSLAEQSDVSMAIYDATGRPVRILINAQQSAGNYNIQWNGTDTEGLGVPTGVYFARLKAGEHSQTIKMVYLK